MDKRERARRYVDGYAEGMDAYVRYVQYSAPLPGSSALAKVQPGCSPECPCMHTEEGWQQGWLDAEASCNL